MATLQSHRLFFAILLLHLLLAAAYTSLVPLGEAPDEPAHLSYARFIAQTGRLPLTLAERSEAGYRASWPPLYHGLVALPLALVGESPPARLKAVGDTPRRLIPTNGQTIAAFIHTAEEAWPWQGLPLAWHLGRLVSILLLALAVVTTYLIAWQLTGQRLVAAGAAAFQAFLPQALFMGSVVSDDTLLILLAGLIVLLVVSYSRQATFPSWGRFLGLGMVLGLATVAKYNALPLWLWVGAWLAWLIYRRPGEGYFSRSQTGVWEREGLNSRGIASGGALLLGAGLTAGWWFCFIWANFNQVESQGWLRGSLAALSAGTADASLRRLAGGSSLSLTWPSFAVWGEWGVTFFRSFWGLFGGGGTIAWPNWIYWLLGVVVLLALGGWLLSKRSFRRNSGWTVQSVETGQTFSLKLIVLLPLLFLPLPLLRFILSGGNIAETAQGRHLFPALPALALLLTLGLTYLGQALRSPLTAYGIRNTQYSVLRIAYSVLRIVPNSLSFLWIPLLLALSLYSLSRIQASYPPLLPLYSSTADKLGSYQPVTAQLAEAIKLIGYEVGAVEGGVLPVTLLWQADETPGEDYLVNLAVTDPAGHLWGGWLGQPLGGRYPTRAWDEGDILRDTIPVPLLAAPAGTTASLSLSLLDASAQSVTPPLTLTSTLHLPDSPILKLPAALRADGLAPAAPFSYRGTISLVGPRQTTAPRLVAPDGQSFAPDQFVEGVRDSLAHFIVAAHWPEGDYQLVMGSGMNSALPGDERVTVPISNRLRQFEIPAMQHRLEANFAGQITVLGYDLPQRVVEPGESFPLTLYLQAERPMGQNLVVFNHLLDAQASQRGGSDHIPKNFYTTLLWVPGEVVSDAYQVPVDGSAPAGIYWLDLGFYPTDKPEFSLPLFADGQPSGRNSLTIGPIKVGGPPPGVTVTAPEPQQRLSHLFGDQIALLGFDLEREGPRLGLRLFWQATTRPQADYSVFIHLLDAEGKLVAQVDGPPAGGAYPASLWEPAEIVVDERRLPDLPPGYYSLRLGLYRPDSGIRLPVPGSSDDAVTLLEFEAPGLP